VSSGKLWSALHDVDSYLRGQSASLVNYAERYRGGLRVGTSITEGTANFLVNRRMNYSIPHASWDIRSYMRGGGIDAWSLFDRLTRTRAGGG
jgi:hypothetical protein